MRTASGQSPKALVRRVRDATCPSVRRSRYPSPVTRTAVRRLLTVCSLVGVSAMLLLATTGAAHAGPAARVALVGVHGFGTHHLRNLERLQAAGAVELVAVADPPPPAPGSDTRTLPEAIPIRVYRPSTENGLNFGPSRRNARL